ncbi:SHD1 domain-containing protein [Kiritimatiellaeota bacterium B1221]|nr:SHD1 domain-containing protein [Kiritimatiellaeota bacterium B1221]
MILLTGWFWFFCGEVSAKVEKWESTQGHEVRAEFVQIVAGAVELKKEDGTLVQVPLSRLSDRSQARAKTRWEKKKLLLPLHVFKMQTYDLRVLNKGKLEFQPKRAGVPQGEPVLIHFKGGFIPSRGNWTARPVIGISEPKLSGKGLEFQLTLQDEVKVTIQFEIEADTLCVGYQVMEPEGVSKGKYQMILSMPEILKTNLETRLMEGPFIRKPVPFADAEAYLKGVGVRVASETKSDKLTYMDSPGEINRPHKYMLFTEALGPKSSFKVEAGKSGYVIHFIYPGKLFWSGFDIYLNKHNDQDPPLGSSNEFKLKLTY